jgi:glycosyltransferase involved in cell wall biosynthesis
MRVSFLTSWDERCGIAEYSRLLVEALRPQIEVAVVPASFRASPKPVYRAMGVALNDGEVAHVQHSYAFFGGMHPWRSGWSALAGAVRRPLVVTVHELDLRPTGAYHLPPALEVAYKRRFNRSVFLHPAVRHWYTHSEELRDALIDLGAPAERVTYRPIPMALPSEPPPDPASLRHQLRLEGKKVLVILGFLARRKGYDVALQALRSLPPDVVLVAAGGEHAADRTGTESWLRGEAERAGVADRLRITGYLDELTLEQATALADVVVAPFREMSASASLSYALARGKAVVASALGENRSLECVRLVPPGEPEALAQALREVLTQPRLRTELEGLARDYACRHSYSALGEETRARYDQLLKLSAR